MPPPLDFGLGAQRIPASPAIRQLPLFAATRCGTIPKDAGAYVLNLTVKPTATLGFLTIWPNGSASGMPVVSNLNDLDGR